MKTLSITNRIDGFEFKLINREGDAALFEKFKPGITTRLFEVVIVQRSADHIGPRGDLILAHEHMPSSEQWGTHGWSYSNLDDAMRKFSALRDQQLSLFAA